MFGFGGTKTEKKRLMLHVQSITLPEMDILEEDELVSVFLERSENNTVNTTEKPLKGLRDNKMGITYDEDLQVPVTMKRQYNGDLKEKICQISVRKRKKGAAGQKDGADAFRIIAWVDLDVKKYADITAGKESYISCKLNWSEKGKDFLGKGALLNAIVMVEENNEDDDDDASTVVSSVSQAKAKSSIVDTKAKLSSLNAVKNNNNNSNNNNNNSPNKKSNDSKSMNKLNNNSNNKKNNHDDDDEEEEDEDDEDEDDNPFNDKNYKNKNNSSNTKTTGKSSMTNTKSNSNSNAKGNATNNKNNNKYVSDDDDDDDESDDEEVEEDSHSKNNTNKNSNSKTGSSNNNNSSNNKNSNSTASSAAVASSKKNTLPIHNKSFFLNTDDDDVDDGDNHQSSSATPSLPFPVHTSSSSSALNNSTSNRNNNNNNSNSSSNDLNPFNMVGRGVTGVVGGVVGGVTGVVGGVTGAFKGPTRNHNQDNNYDDTNDHNNNNDSNNHSSTSSSNEPLPKFLAEFKQRAFIESATKRLNQNNLSNLSYPEIHILKLLEESRLENIRLRESVINFEMQNMKCQFFGSEVARIQDLIENEKKTKSLVEAELSSLQKQCELKIEENSYLVDELIDCKAQRDVYDKQKTETINNMEALKLLVKQEKIRKEIAEQKRLKEEHDNRSIFSAFGF